MSLPRWAPAAAGALAGALAWLDRGGISGGIAWVATLAVASFGYGLAVERATRQRVTAGLTITAGLASLLAVSTIAARLGVLTARVELVAVVAGVAATLLPRERREPSGAAWPRPGVALVIAAIVSCALVAIALVRLEPVLADHLDHAFVVKRLWDVGRLGIVPHQAGLQLVGEAYLALTSGAQAAGVFEAACAALLLFVLASELSALDGGTGDLLLLVVVVVIALRLPATGTWSATAFHLATILALRAATRGRVAWHAVITALALTLVHDDLVFLAGPYVLAALVLPEPKSQYTRLAIVAWLVATIPLQLALGAHGIAPAAARTIVMAGALPLGWLLLRLLGPFELRTPVGAACLAVASATLAGATYAVRPAQHAPSSTFAIWFAVALVLFVASEQPDRIAARAPIRAGTASLLLAAVIAATLAPMIRVTGSVRAEGKYATAVIALRDRWVAGDQRADQDAVAALQRQVPRSARIAFWGTDAGGLDFTRNPIRDISVLAGRGQALVPAPPGALRGCDYVIAEGDAISPRRDPWLARREEPRVPPLERVRARLALVSSAGWVRLYRVVR